MLIADPKESKTFCLLQRYITPNSFAVKQQSSLSKSVKIIILENIKDSM